MSGALLGNPRSLCGETIIRTAKSPRVQNMSSSLKMRRRVPSWSSSSSQHNIVERLPYGPPLSPTSDPFEQGLLHSVQEVFGFIIVLEDTAARAIIVLEDAAARAIVIVVLPVLKRARLQFRPGQLAAARSRSEVPIWGFYDIKGKLLGS